MIRCLKSCLRHRYVRALVAVVTFAAFVLLLVLLVFLAYYERKAFDYDIEAVGRIPVKTTVLDATDTPVGYLNKATGSNLPLKSVSKYFVQALLAREDTRFYRHHGVDHIGLVRANLRNVREGRVVQGASTITMQLARMTFELREKNYQRKLVEMAIARRIERHYDKDEILRLYINRIYLGTGMHGIEDGADGYFGKHPSQLNLSEAAMIAGIIRAPNGFSPFRQKKASIREMRMTLARMEDEGHITKREAQAAASMVPTVLPQSRWADKLRARNKGFHRNWYLNMIEAQLAERLPVAKWHDGLVVRTTIDHRVQTGAETAVRKWLAGVERVPGYDHPKYPAVNAKGEPTSLQGACVVIDNLDGSIRALVGGRDYDQSAYNRAIHENRQAGSIIKPIVYAAAFETGMLPGAYVSDELIGPLELDWWHGPDWDPVNADGVHQGLHPAHVGLKRSRNTMTVRVGERAGIDTVNRMLSHAGVAKDGGAKDPQIYIGNQTVSLLAMTSAYTAFPMAGARYEPHLISSIHDRQGNLLFEHRPQRYQVFSKEAAWMTSTILESVLEDGGSGARLRKWGFDAPAGGKTGTTNDFVDAWFVGYTSRLTAGFWVGLDIPAPMVNGAYGGSVAMPMWKDTMLAAQATGYEADDFPRPSEVFPVRVCRHTGLLASSGCEAHGCAYTEDLPSSLIPRKFCKRESK